MEQYQLHDMELSEYTRILPKRSGIPKIIYIDECNSFKRWKHPLWAIVSEDSPYEDNWVGISLSKYPKILRDCDNKSPEFLEVIQETKEIISKFYQILIEIGFEFLDSDILYDIFTNYNWRTLTPKDILNLRDQLYNEYTLVDTEKQMLSEMTILKSD